MSHIYRKRPNTRLQIIQLAAHLFIEEGYSSVSMKRIAAELDLSPGNVTFYFPTKDHLLAVLVDELFDFQGYLMDQAAAEGKTSLLAYCLELVSIAAACEESEAVRDFYASSYSSPYTLELIRENDTQKTKRVFGEFCPDFTDEDWIANENIVSGIEYATIMTREEKTPLSVQIDRTLDAIMLLYRVPEQIRHQKIEKVLKMDYRAMGMRILGEFKEYIKRINEENLKNATQIKRSKIK